MASQLMLFEVQSSKRKDGVFEIVPVKVFADREIGVRATMKLLGYKKRQRIYDLLDEGKIRGWKPESERGNGKWRIYESSVLDYKRGRTEAAARGEA